MLTAGFVLQDRYTIEGVLGQGGMGVVYRARVDRLGGRPLAIKAMTFSGGDAAERAAAVQQFVQEASLLASLEHPGLVHVTDFFEEGGNWYLVMTLVEGRTLHDICFATSGFLPVPTVMGWIDGVADVLEYLHGHNPPIIFRDLKPSNVMLDSSGRPRLIDFGIAKVSDPDTTTSTLLKGAGSAGYTAPEQYAMGTTDARTDVYALGATCWTLLTRQVPPPVVRIMMGEVAWVPARALNAAVSHELDAVISRMVAIPKDQRFQSVAEARQALREALGTTSGMAEVFKQAQAPASEDRRRLERGLQDLSRRAPASHEAQRMVGDVPTGMLEPFVGRAQEMAALRDALHDGATRLVTLVGRSGNGKSALLARFVADLEQPVVYLGLRYPEQRSVDTLVELLSQTLDDADAAALQSCWRGSGALERRLRQLVDRWIAGRAVLVLDNLEEVLDAENRIVSDAGALGAFIVACLEARQPVHLLAGSRRPLLLPPADAARLGERCQEILLDDGLLPDDAVALLGALGLRDAPHSALRTLAAAAWGVPRTLQTLVGTLRTRRTLTLDKLLADEALLERLTSDPARELYDSLTVPERLVMQVLALYGRPVPDTAVRWLLPGLPIEDLLEGLLRACAVTCHHDRFALSPQDAAYALRQTPQDDGPYGRAALHRRAAEFYRQIRRPLESCSTLADVEAPLAEFRHQGSAGEHDAAAELLRELDQPWLTPRGHARVVVAMRLTLSPQSPELALENVAMLGLALMNLGDVMGCREPLERALQMAQVQEDRIMRLRILGALGSACADLGEHREAARYAEEALQEARAVEDHEAAAVLGANLGASYSQLGDYTTAAQRLEEALQAAETQGTKSLEMTCCGNLGALHSDLGKLDEACRWIDRALRLARELGSLPDIAMWSGQRGNIMREKGATEEAVEALQEARRQASAIGQQHFWVMWTTALAASLMDLGQYGEALSLLEEALGAAETAQDPVARLQALGGIASVEVACGALSTACRRLEECLGLLAVSGSEVRRSFWLARLAEVHVLLGDTAAAEPLLVDAMAIAKAAGLRPALAYCLGVESRRRLYLSDRVAALQCLEEAMQLGGAPPVRAGRLVGLGRIHHLNGDLEAAAAAFVEARSIPAPMAMYRAAFGLALVRLEQGRRDEATRLLTDARRQAEALLEGASALCDPQNVLGLIAMVEGGASFDAEAARGSRPDLQLDLARIARLHKVGGVEV